MRKWMLVLGMGLVQTAALAQQALPVAVKPTDPNLHYTGRFDLKDGAGPRCQWSASMVTIRFKGTDLQAGINEGGDNYYEVVLDGKTLTVIHPSKGVSVVDLARNVPDGEHIAQFVRRTEAHLGITQFTGFYLNAGGQLLVPPKSSRKIEVIGDSITCGYGNESTNKKEPFIPRNENAWMSYGAIAARAVDAEYVAVAWSGRTMWPKDTMPEVYDRILPDDAVSKWDFSAWQPDVVLINLATNDFGQTSPDEATWTAAYKDFLRHVRKNYPHAMIYIASGSMMTDDDPPGTKLLSTLKLYLERIETEMKAEGEAKIRQIHFDPQNVAIDGIGGHWHPNIKTHQKMAQRWIAALERDMGWKPVTK